MRLNTAIVISSIILVIGLLFKQPYLWIPTTVLLASGIDLFVREWVMSDRLGSMTTASMLLKFLFSLIMFYAMIGQFVSIGLAFWWFI